MKTQAEIRAHRNDLLASAQMPCDCKRTGHAEDCIRGGLMMAAAARALSWVLGECPEMDKAVERLRDDVRRVREGN